MKYPCWLTKEQLEQAQALIDLGFHYCGDVDEYLCGAECKLGTVGSWQLLSATGEFCLLAKCDGALYSWDLEHHPQLDDAVKYPKFFQARLAEAKKAIKTVIRNQKLKEQSEAIQLSLF